MKKVKIGGVYLFDHSEFTNTMLCYDIDYINKIVYLVSVDDGAGFNELWFDTFPYKKFDFRCIECKNIILEDGSITFFYELLAKLLHSLITDKNNNIRLYDSPSDDIANDIKRNWKIIEENNPQFKSVYHNFD